MLRILVVLLLLKTAMTSGALFETTGIPGPFSRNGVPEYSADLPGVRQLWLSGRVLLRHELPELSTVSSSFSIRRMRWGAALRFRTFGWEIWRENRYDLDLAWSPFRGASAGMRLSLLTLRGWENPGRAAFSLGFGCRLDLGSSLMFRAAVRNINEPQLGRESLSCVQFEMEAGVEWRPLPWLAPGISFLNTASERDGVPVFHLRLGEGAFSLELRADPSPFTFNLTVCIKTGRFHTRSGMTLWSGIPAIGYGTTVSCLLLTKERPVDETKRININSVPAEALMRLPGMKPSLAWKIRHYRKLYGPFRRLRDLCRIRGINRRRLKAWETLIAVDERGSRSLALKEGKAKNGFDINLAEIREFQEVGVDPETARRIILFRERVGGFAALTDLHLVPGLLPQTGKRIRILYEK